MRSTRKNLVIDPPKQNTFKYERQQQLFSQSHYKKAQIKKCYTLLDNYTGQIFQTKQKPALDRYTSLNSIPLSKGKKPKELSLLIQETSSETSKKNSKHSRRLTFTPKGQKIKQRRVVQVEVEDKTKKSLVDITKEIKNLIQSLKLYLFEVNSKMKQFMQYFISNFVQNWDDFKNQKQRQKQKNTQMMSVSNQVVEKSFNIELESFKVEKILDKYQKLTNQMQFMPTLNLSNILNRQSSDVNQKIGEQNFPNKKRKIRQPQTQRFNAKKFEFDPPKNNSKNFSVFNETLNKMKRLTFQGSILKL